MPTVTGTVSVLFLAAVPSHESRSLEDGPEGLLLGDSVFGYLNVALVPLDTMLVAILMGAVQAMPA